MTKLQLNQVKIRCDSLTAKLARQQEDQVARVVSSTLSSCVCLLVQQPLSFYATDEHSKRVTWPFVCFVFPDRCLFLMYIWNFMSKPFCTLGCCYLRIVGVQDLDLIPVSFLSVVAGAINLIFFKEHYIINHFKWLSRQVDASELQKRPLSFTWQDGTVESLCPDQEDPAWVVNIKRSVLSMLQHTAQFIDVPESHVVEVRSFFTWSF